MPLDLEKLEQVRERGGRILAACPACREAGEDRSGAHLVILDGGLGKWGCVAHAGHHGKEHRRRIAELVGAGVSDIPLRTPPPPPLPVRRPARPLPALRAPSAEELAHIACVRGWPTAAGFEVLATRGQLFVGDVWDDGRTWPAWLVGDSTRANIQARRMDGGTWPGIGGKKAKSLPGTTTTRMIGPADIGTRPLVWLCEGQPDFAAAPIVAKLAGLDLDHIAFVCVTGAGNSIAPDDLAHFVGKIVTIAVHADGAGAEAAGRWARLLYDAGAVEVVGFDFTASAGKDLADHLAALAKPAPLLPAHAPRPAPQEPAALAASAAARPLLVPLESPWIAGARYRLAGAHEIRTRLPLFIEDANGDTRRALGCLISHHA